MIPLPWLADNAGLYLTPRWAAFDSDATYVFLALPLVLVLLLALYELRLVRWYTAVFLASLRLTVLAVLVGVVGLEPVIAYHHSEELPSTVAIVVDLSSSMDVADPPGKSSLRDQAAALLLESKLLDKLGDRHQIQILGFQRHVWAMTFQELANALGQPAGPDGQASNLRTPLAKILDESGNQAHLGVILLSDGRHNLGPAPLDLARALGKRQTPIFPIALGTKQPLPDLAVIDVQGPTNILKNSEASLRVRVKASALPPQKLIVELARRGKPVLPEHRQVLEHDGKDHVYTLPFQVHLDDVGTHSLEVKVKPSLAQPAEVTTLNNQATALVRVLKDKARVLLVDEDARWENHYLAMAFQRDPALDVTRVLFSQPRLGLVSDKDLETQKFPLLRLPVHKSGVSGASATGEDPLFQFDAIFLGDVAPEHLPLADRRRLERYVAHRGGTLILLAGKRFFPGDYDAKSTGNDPLLKLLPIIELQPLKLDDGFSVALSSEGQTTSFLQLESAVEDNQRRWSELPRHYWAMVGKPRPAANILAFPRADKLSTPAEKEQGLIVTQPYGFGRVLYVGLDSTWRWRYRKGDVLHHRFWGQVARWAGADQLLPAGNAFVRYGARAPLYRQGKDVEIAVRLAEGVGPLPATSKPAARIYRRGHDGKEETVALVPLQKNDKQGNLLEARVSDLPPGDYRLELDIAEIQDKIAAPAESKDKEDNRAIFAVLPTEEGELLDLGMNWPLLHQLAADSGGAVISASDIDQLVDRLQSKIVIRESKDEERLWQDEPLVWWTLGLLLTLLCLEWITRKLVGLP